MTETGSKYRCPFRGNELLIAGNFSGNLLHCNQALVKIGQGFTYSV
jgi:hypothetical protein